MGSTDNNFDLKLLLDKKSNKVLFGEASKDFVDFIFSLLALPLGAVTKLLSKDVMVGSIGELYSSLSKLNDAYVGSYVKVSSLLNPPFASTSNPNTNFLLPPAPHQDTPINRKLYGSSCNRDGYSVNNCVFVSAVKGAACPYFQNGMNREFTFVGPNSDDSVVAVVGSENKGYVKGVVTYSVMDDLTVVPMSTISSITLLNKFNIKDLGSLEEKSVRVGFEETPRNQRLSLLMFS